MRRLLVSAIAIALAGATLDAAAQDRRAARRAARHRCDDAVAAQRAADALHDRGRAARGQDELRRQGRDPRRRAGADRQDRAQRGRHDLRQRRCSIRANGKVQKPKVSIDAAAQTATFTFDAAAARRPVRAVDRLHRQDRHAGQRPVRDRLREQGRQAARAVHAVRSLRRPQVHSVLRRAQLQGGVRPDRRRAGQADGREQHAGRRYEGTRQRPEAREVRDLAEDVDLPAVLRRGRLRARDEDAGPDRSRRGHAARRVGPGEVRAGFLGRRAQGIQRLLRHPVSAAEARQRRVAGPQPVLRRDGKLGRDLHLRIRAAARPDDLHAVRQAGRVLHRRA